MESGAAMTHQAHHGNVFLGQQLAGKVRLQN
jgi:hypothetical protein